MSESVKERVRERLELDKDREKIMHWVIGQSTKALCGTTITAYYPAGSKELTCVVCIEMKAQRDHELGK